MKELFKTIGSYRRSVCGNISIIASLSILVLMVGVGAAIDLNRLSSAKISAQDGLDAALLAAGAYMNEDMPNISIDEKKTKAKQMAISQLSAESSLKNFNVTLTETDIVIDDNSIYAKTNGRGDPVVIQLLGNKNLGFEVDSKVMFGRPNTGSAADLDIVVILDITGSMAWLLEPLKTNLINFSNDLSDLLDAEDIDAGKIRLKVILYRDWFNSHQSIWRNIYYGPDTLTVLEWGPMYGSPFYSLPEEKADIPVYLSNFNASRGRDVPESAIEPISYALHADDWNPDAKKLILLWTDAPAKDTFENIHQLVGHYYYNDSNELFNWRMDEFYEYENAFAAFHQSNLDKMDAADHAGAISMSINMYSNIVPTTDLGAFDLILDWPGVEFNDNRTPDDENVDVTGFDLNYVAPGPDVAYADVLKRAKESVVSLTSGATEKSVYISQ